MAERLTYFQLERVLNSTTGTPPEGVEYSFERGLLYDPNRGPMWMLWYAIFGTHSRDEAIEEFLGKPITEIFDQNGQPKAEYKKSLQT